MALHTVTQVLPAHWLEPEMTCESHNWDLCVCVCVVKAQKALFLRPHYLFLTERGERGIAGKRPWPQTHEEE